MSNAVLITEIFLRAGTAFAALVLTAWYGFTRSRRPTVLGLITPATWLAAFYALCMLMIGVVSLIRAGASDTGAGAAGRAVFALLPFVAVVILFLTVRRRAQGLLLPFALLINASLVFKDIRGDVDELLIQLWSLKPYVLLSMGLLYLLVLFLLHLLGRRVRVALKETDPA